MNRKSKNLVVAQSHKAGYLSCSSVDVGIPKTQAPMQVKEWTCCQGETKQAKKEQTLPSSIVLLAEGLAQIKAVLFILKIWIKGIFIQPRDPDQRPVVFLPQGPDHKCALDFWIIVHSRCSQVDNQEKSSQQINR